MKVAEESASVIVIVISKLLNQSNREYRRFEGDKLPTFFWKNPENSRLELMTHLLANTFIIARKWPKLTHFYQLHKTQ